MPKYSGPKPLNFKAYSFPLVRGTDTKVDGIALPAPSLKRMHNAYMDKTGATKKRPGYTNFSDQCFDGTSIPTPSALAVYKDNLLLFGEQGFAAEYGQTPQLWMSGKGPAYSLKVSSNGVTNGVNATSLYSYDIATVNGYTVTAFAEAVSPSTTTATVKVTITDADGTTIAANSVVESRTAASLPIYGVRCVVFGNLVYVFYNCDAPAIKLFTINTANTSTITASLAASPVSVVTNVMALTTSPSFDVSVNATFGVFLTYLTNTVKQIRWGFVSSSGTFSSASTYTAPNQPLYVACAVAPNNQNHCIGYLDYAGPPNDLYLRHYSFNGATWSLLAGSGALETALTADLLTLTLRYDSVSVVRAWACGDAATTTSTELNSKIYVDTYDTSGTSTTRASTTMRKSWLSSKPFSYNGELFYWVYAGPLYSSTQPTLFLIRSADAKVVAKAFEGTATPVGPITGPQFSTPVVSGNEITCAFATVRKLVGTGSTGSSFLGTGTVIALKHLKVTFDHAEGWKSAESGDALYLAGDGFLRLYDGDRFVESDFLRYVESGRIAVTSTLNAGGFTASATYVWKFIPERTTDKGEVQWGTTDGNVSVTMTATPKEQQFKIPAIPFTNMSDMVIAVYRSGPNPGANDPLYRIGQVDNSTTTDELTFTDNGIAVAAESIYLGEEVDNFAPPSCHIMCTGNGRVFLAGAEIDPNRIWFSKQRVQGRTTSFNDSFVIDMPGDGGPIVAMEFMNRTLVVFKKDRIYFVEGDGPSNFRNDASSFYPPRLVNSDTGCVSSRSVIAHPMGIFFQAPRGIMLLTLTGELVYIGDKVEDFTNDADVVATLIDPARQHIRFALDDGNVLLFDYFHKIWSSLSYGPGTPESQ